MAKTKELPPININLTVAEVGFGGNTGKGKKFYYAFDHESIILKDVGVTVIVNLLGSINTDVFKITQVIFGGGQNVLKQLDEKTDRMISFKNISSSPCSVGISILCSYQKNKGDAPIYFNCDPQVINDPDPE